MFGPKPRDYSYSLPRKVRHMGMRIALSTKYAQGKVTDYTLTRRLRVIADTMQAANLGLGESSIAQNERIRRNLPVG